MPKQILSRGFGSLNTVDDPVQVNSGPRATVSDLQVAMNVVIARSKRANRRPGTTKKLSGNYKSIFCDGGECVAVDVDNERLSLIERTPDGLTSTALVSLESMRRMAYAQAGQRIYYTNGHDLGYVEAGIRHAWVKNTDYVGPTTTKTFSSPIPGDHLALHGGRMYISLDNYVFYSEYGTYGWFNYSASYFPFRTKVRMMKSVAAGLYISTENQVHFLQGFLPSEMTPSVAVTYPALEWSDAIGHMDSSGIPRFKATGGCAFWVSGEGAIIGLPSGMAININKKKVVYPGGNSGSGLIKGLNFIHTID